MQEVFFFLDYLNQNVYKCLSIFNVVGNGKLSEQKFIKVHDYWHTIMTPVFINILIVFSQLLERHFLTKN